MAKHLPGKTARLISDFLTIGRLVDVIEHELEKRIVARHGLVKLDALLNLVARLKNEVLACLPLKSKREIKLLEKYIDRLRKDLADSDMETGRDAMAAHALHLDLRRIVDTWTCMNATTYGVLASDLQDIDSELLRLSRLHPTCLAYPGATTWTIEPAWQTFWRHEQNLGDPKRPRLATVYPGLATAGMVAPLPGGHPAQDVTIRAVGLATFLRQEGILLQAVSRGSEVERLFAEMIVNDYFALWELLFTSGVQNDHGNADLCVLEHWRLDKFKGAACLANMHSQRHPAFESWRNDVRNKATAHVDADSDIWTADLNRWPMTVDDLIDEALRVIEAARRCAAMDVRSRFLFQPPQFLSPDVVGLAAQEGRHWRD
ncbi:MAG: hypothetical protein K2Y05_09190 [Hyphomicrobiaceae bacterium]|nr:hypothetical protein [Hyphomicrobiaceae bacterium]